MDLNEFYAVIFEWGTLAYRGTFSDDLFQENLYASIGLITTITSLILVLSFYFIINRPSFSRWHHWSIMLLMNSLIAFLIGYFIPQNIFYGLGIQTYESIEYITFGLITSITVIPFFVVWTYCFKWWKSHAKGTPKLFFGKF